MYNNLKFTIITPAYNEGEALPIFISELKKFINKQCEVIVVDDGSTDNTWQLIKDICQKDSRFRGIRLSRNFGHQSAIYAGMFAVNQDSEFIITMDSDLQHPPQLIKSLIEKYEEGYKVVHTHRDTDSDDMGLFKRVTARWYYKIFNTFSDVKVVSNSDFRLFSREINNQILNMNEKQLFFRGLFSWMGYSDCVINYKAANRVKGTTKFTLFRMLALAETGIVIYSNKLLRVFPIISLAILSTFFFTLMLVGASNDTNINQITIAIINLMSAIIIMLNIAVIGVYLISLRKQFNPRPMFVIDELI